MRPSKTLTRREFGDPILRKKARRVTKAEITSEKIQALITDMQHTLKSLKLGVGLAAPQVGVSLQLAVICIQPMAHRPDVTPFEEVLINPVITDRSEGTALLWEGCISSGSGETGLFAKVPRYKEISVTYQVADGTTHKRAFSGLPAQVIQHEVDHLHGSLFVDRVEDTSSYMTYAEYVKRIRSKTTTGSRDSV
jgi:peptide deformylase